MDNLEIIDKALTTNRALYKVSVMMNQLDIAIKKSGGNRDDLIKLIIDKYFSNVYLGLDEDLEALSRGNKQASYYAILMKSVKVNLVDAVNRVNADKPIENFSFLFAIKMWISCIYRIMNIKFNIFNYADYISNKDNWLAQVKDSLSEEEFKAYAISLEDTFSITNNTRNYLKSLNISDEELVKHNTIAKNNVINLGTSVREILLEVNLTVKLDDDVLHMLYDYEDIITKEDIYTLVSKTQECGDSEIAGEELEEKLESRLDSRSLEISAYNEITNLYFTIMQNAKMEEQHFDITRIPYDILCEVCLVERPTERLLDFIHSEQALEGKIDETSEFGDN